MKLIKELTETIEKYEGSRYMSEEIASNPSAKAVKELKFHFIKSNFYRVVHGDGIFGGITPTGKIQMAVFSQRHPFPQVTVHRMDGNLIGPEIERISKDGIVREIEVGIVMDLELAISLRKWIDDKIVTLQATEGRK